MVDNLYGKYLSNPIDGDDVTGDKEDKE